MAENDTGEVEVVTEPPNAKLGMMQILMIVGIALVTQISVTVVNEMFFSPDPTVAEAEAVEEEEEVPEEEIDFEDLGEAKYLPLDPALVVNLQDGDKSRFLQASIQLMTRDEEVYAAAKTHSPAIRNALIMLFGTADYEKISTREGKEQLREDARKVADAVLQDLANKQGIEAVYLTSFVIQ